MEKRDSSKGMYNGREGIPSLTPQHQLQKTLDISHTRKNIFALHRGKQKRTFIEKNVGTTYIFLESQPA
jgi:hypothetical protein